MLQAVWVEIPVNDVERAKKFYEAVFALETVEIVDDGTRKTATLTMGTPEGAPGISLNQTQNFEPSNKGVYAYLMGGDDLTEQLGLVEEAGGKIVAGKTSMGPAGHFATIEDTEGNHIGLYSSK